MFLIGEANFARGVQSYMDRFRWSNATILDLLEDLRPYFPSEVSVDDWKTTWLESPSLNVIGSIWSTADTSASATLTIKQIPFASEFSTVRWHKFEVAFFNANAEVTEIKTVMLPPSEGLLEV